MDSFLSQAISLVNLWKHRLGLLEWDVVVYIHDEDESSQARGSIYWNFETLEARLGLTHPMLFSRTAIGLIPLEEIIVHELLHLVFHGVKAKEDSHRGVLFEQGLNRTMRALIKAYGPHNQR